MPSPTIAIAEPASGTLGAAMEMTRALKRTLGPSTLITKRAIAVAERLQSRLLALWTRLYEPRSLRKGLQGIWMPEIRLRASRPSCASERLHRCSRADGGTMTLEARRFAATAAMGLAITSVWACSPSSSPSGAPADDGGGTSSSEGSSGGTSTGGGTYAGAVSLGQSTLGGIETTTGLALFTKTPGPDTSTTCTQTKSGPCTLNRCQLGDGGAPTEFSAGTITITGGTLSAPITLTYDAATGYSVFSATTPIYTPGETFNVSAVGADVAAFSGVSAAAPNDIVITSPSGGTATNLMYAIDESTDLVITWTGGSAGAQVAVNLSNLDDHSLALNANCMFDASAGTGTIPTALLTQLGSFTSGYLQMYPISTASVASANATVTITVEGTPTAGIATSP